MDVLGQKHWVVYMVILPGPCNLGVMGTWAARGVGEPTKHLFISLHCCYVTTQSARLRINGYRFIVLTWEQCLTVFNYREDMNRLPTLKCYKMCSIPEKYQSISNGH